MPPFLFEPTSEYRHLRTGEAAAAHLKGQIMGREVGVAISRGKPDLGPCEQILTASSMAVGANASSYKLLASDSAPHGRLTR